MLWYEQDGKRAHFSVIIFSQLLAGCIISLKVYVWAHRTNITLLLVLCIEVPVPNIEVISDVY